MEPTPDWTEFLDLLRIAPAGNRALDAQIDCALHGRHFDGMTASGHYRWRICCEAGEATPVARWSEDLVELLRLVPSDYDFSMGDRDGVRWVWIQPHDNWTPAGKQVRHDHPRGSGLIVAQTLALAMATALISLRALPNASVRYDPTQSPALT